MSNSPHHLDVVKKGYSALARWQRENPDTVLNLAEADLRGVDLRRADLRRADLRAANLQRAYLAMADLNSARLNNAKLYRTVLDLASLVGADLVEAQLERADLIGADLRKANLYRANLYSAVLNHCILSGADLRDVDLRGGGLWRANLSSANLSGANLSGAVLDETSLTDADLSHSNLREATFLTTNLCRANLVGADLSGAKFSAVICADLNLSSVIGLDIIVHSGPSTLGLDTLYKSRGTIPVEFLRGCGFSEWETMTARLYEPDLTDEAADTLIYELRRSRVGSAIQIRRLFISHSYHDSAFIGALEPKLNAHGIRFWRDTHDLKVGRLEAQLTRAISLNATVLLVLSENSVKSDWDEWEAANARKLEKTLNRDVLCPITLDNAWRTCQWPGPLRRQIEDYHVLDFSRWRDASWRDGQFAKLIEGLQLFYRGT